MHPNKFFKEVNCRTGIDVFELFDTDMKEKLMSIHPLNFIKTKITLPVMEVTVEYDTDKNNHKTVNRYMVMDNSYEEEYADFWADMFVRDFVSNSDKHIFNCNITKITHICDAVLPIG